MGENRDRDREREQRERERKQREQERREQERLERQQDRLEDKRPDQPPQKLPDSMPGTTTVTGSGLGGGPGSAPSHGAPTGTIPRGKIGGGGPWDLVNRFDATFVAEGRKHGVPPTMLKSMMIVETGGKNVADPFGASGVMQIKREFWDDRARAAGYDLGTDEGQIGMAAAIVGGSVPGVSGTTPLERFLSTYYPIPGGLDAVGESGHTQRMYLDDIAFYTRLIEEAGGSQGDAGTGGTAAGSAGVEFGRVPQPAITDRLIPDEFNTAWNDLGQRSPKGIVYHRQVGTNWGTDGWFRLMWQPNGEPGGGQRGLTDFGVDRTTGEILMWNDFTGRGYPDRGISTNRAGWAPGPWHDPPGDGRAYVAKFGVDAINRDLVSIEIDGNYDSPIEPAGFEAICRLSAWLADQAQVPWTDYPRNPHTGLVFTYVHSEFQQEKPCPGEVVLGRVDEIIERTKEILRQHQTGGGPVTATATTAPATPPKETRLSKMKLPTGVTVDDLREWFGDQFDPDGEVTLVWAEEGIRTGTFPRLERFDPPGPVCDFEFAGGLKIRADNDGVRIVRGTG